MLFAGYLATGSPMLVQAVSGGAGASMWASGVVLGCNWKQLGLHWCSIFASGVVRHPHPGAALGSRLPPLGLSGHLSGSMLAPGNLLGLSRGTCRLHVRNLYLFGTLLALRIASLQTLQRADPGWACRTPAYLPGLATRSIAHERLDPGWACRTPRRSPVWPVSRLGLCSFWVGRRHSECEGLGQRAHGDSRL